MQEYNADLCKERHDNIKQQFEDLKSWIEKIDKREENKNKAHWSLVASIGLIILTALLNILPMFLGR